jgi:hypothetical protein
MTNINCGKSSSLTVNFTPNQPISKGGWIALTFPYFNANSGASTMISLIPSTPQPTLSFVEVILFKLT